MKFLAILKDSLREALDAKVFYVMIGLSLLVILVAATITFTPTAGGEAVMKGAAASLLVDKLSDLEDFTNPQQALQAFLNKPRNVYEVLKVEPKDGAADAPTSPFLVLLGVHLLADDGAGAKDPSAVEAHIRERFGRLETWHLADVEDVRPAKGPDGEEPGPQQLYYLVTARPADAALRLWPHKFSLFFGAVPFGQQGMPLGLELLIIESGIVGGFGAWVAILAGVIITAFFIPNMLRKGSVDLLIVKPIHRTTLLLYKYVGGLTFIFLTTAFTVTGVWLVLGLRSGVWGPGMLWMVPAITFFFAILYACSTLFGVMTRSPIVAILLTCLMWFVLYIVGQGNAFFEGMRVMEERQKTPEDQRIAEGKFAKVVKAIHFVMPRAKDIDHLTDRVLIRDLVFANQVQMQKVERTSITWGESLTVCGIYIALMLGVACWWFATKDY
jgi:ABC-type transport system involved in multi-copper enzyme maturation permease subunit